MVRDGLNPVCLDIYSVPLSIKLSIHVLQPRVITLWVNERHYIVSAGFGFNSFTYSKFRMSGASNCGVIKRTRDGVPWWTKNQSLLLQDPNECVTDDIRPGVVAMEYDGIPDFSQPDNVGKFS